MNTPDNPLHAKFYADCAMQCEAVVEDRRELAHETWLVRLSCPEIAGRIKPGQFLMVRTASELGDPLLGRAFAMYDVVSDANGEPHFVDIVFHVVGKMTSHLAEIQSGQKLNIWGPLGNGFMPQPTEHLVMVAGGIGQTPFLALAKEYLGLQNFGREPSRAKRVSLCYGARSEQFLAGVDDFLAAGVEVQIATDDGSAGHHGLVTDVLRDVVDNAGEEQLRICCCGPERMMEAVSEYCVKNALDCQVSLETPMACGLGICFSCVARVKQPDGSWDFKRTCVDGPVFAASELVW